jgi:hypothetical protein
VDSNVSDVVAAVAAFSVVLFLAGVIVAMAVVVLEEDRVFMVLCIAAVVVTGNARCDDRCGRISAADASHHSHIQYFRDTRTSKTFELITRE